MTILGTFDFDSQTPGAVISTLTAPWSLSVAPREDITAVAAAKMHGTLGGRIENSSLNGAIRYRDDTAGTALRVLDVYIRPRTIAAATYVLGLRSTSAAIGDVGIWSDGTVGLRNGTTPVADSGSTKIATDGSKWYRFSWGTTGTTQELRVYEGETTTPIITLTGPLSVAGRLYFNTGTVYSVTGSSIDYDTIRVADEWVGPFGDPVVPLATPTNVTVTASTTQLQATVSWTAVSGAASYGIEIQRKDGTSWVSVGTVTATASPRVLSASDGLQQGLDYRVRVQARP